MREHMKTWGWTTLLVAVTAMALGGCGVDGGDTGEPAPTPQEPAEVEPAEAPAQPDSAAKPDEAGSAEKSASDTKACCPVAQEKTCCPAGQEKACCAGKKKCVVLFDGTDLSGWQNARKPEDENKWSIEDGAMTNVDHGNDIATKESYKDFCLCLEYKTVKEGNSGVYLRGRIEVQVFDSHGKEEVGTSDDGAIFGQTPPKVNASKPAGEWNALMACYNGDTLSVKLNGQLIHDKLKITKLTGGALPGGVNEPGPLMLQGDHGKVWYRNIRICPLEEGQECPMGPGCPLMGGACCPKATCEGSATKQEACCSGKKDEGSETKSDEEGDEDEKGLDLGENDDFDEFDYSGGGGSQTS